MAILAVSILTPIFWAGYSATKTELDYYLNVLGWPKETDFNNFIRVFTHLNVKVTTAEGQQTVGFIQMFLNSVIVLSHPSSTAFKRCFELESLCRTDTIMRSFSDGLSFFSSVLDCSAVGIVATLDVG